MGHVGGGAGGIGGILASTQAGGPAYYHYDFNGNIVNVSSSTQTQLAKYTYSPFGEVLLKEGDFDSRYQFSTKEYDPSTGLNYYGFRSYNPELGRWLNRDPLGDLAFRRIKEHSTQLAGFVDLSIHQIQKPIPSVNVGVSALQEQHRRILDSRRERSNADQKKNDDLLLGSMSYVALLNNPIQNHDFLGLHTVADCDADYDDCIAGCNGLSTARERCLCYIGCMTVYSGCLATAEEVLIIGGCVIVGGIIIYCTGGAAAPAVCCAL